MANVVSSPPTLWRAVDPTAGDYDCVAERGRNVRALRIITPSGTSNPAVVWREDGEAADFTCALVAGTVEFFTGNFTHVRQTGTSSGLTIMGAV